MKRKLEPLNESKFKTLEKEQMTKITGGLKQPTSSSMPTLLPNNSGVMDTVYSEDAPPPPQWT